MRWRRWQRELDEEMATHRALKRDALAASSGCPTEPARLTAATDRAMGNELAMREAAREQWFWPWLEAFAQGLRQGARRLRRSPGFTLAAVATLALGIGANVAIFSVVEAVMLRPLPYPAPQELVALRLQRRGSLEPSFNMPQFQFLRTHLRSLAAVAAFRGTGTVELRQGRAVAWESGVLATAGLFRVLGVEPRMGRGFAPNDEQAGAPCAVVLTDAAWQHDFGAANPGQAITVDGELCTLVGILPPGFVFQQNRSANPQFFVAMQPGHGLGDQGLNSEIIGRLRPGWSAARAGSEAAALTPPMRARNLLPSWASGVGVNNYQVQMTAWVRGELWFLWAAVGLLLLIACANVTGLLLARTLARQPELALRRALGAGRSRLFVQFLTEGLLLALLGGAAALGLAAAVLRTLAAQLPWDVPLGGPIALDSRVLLFALTVVACASLVFAVAAAGQGAARPLGIARFRRRSWARDLVVAAQVALSLMLLAGAGLLGRSLAWLENRPLGFAAQGRMVFQTQLPAGAAPARDAILARLRALPGVTAAAAISLPPLEGQNNLPGEAAGRPETGTAVEFRSASPGYFALMGIPLLRGRDIGAQDTAAAPLTAVVSQSLARAWFGGRALGREVRIGAIGGQQYMDAAFTRPRTIIGVVADVRTQQVDQPMRLTVYVPAAQGGGDAGGWFALQARSVSASGIRQAVAAVNPAIRVSDLAPMETVVAHTLAGPRFEAWLGGGFALLALALTAVGLYALLGCAVTERRQEIGVRLALGASRRSVLALIAGRGMALVAFGAAAGLVAALLLSRLLAALLSGVQPNDPLTIAAALALLLLIALAACILPAWRATRIDAVTALRCE